MSHHGREGEREYTDADYERLSARAGSMLALIKDIANGAGEDGSDYHGGQFAPFSPAQACDAWLEKNNFECAASRRRQRERRAEQLDREIEKLRAERAGL